MLLKHPMEHILEGIEQPEGGDEEKHGGLAPLRHKDRIDNDEQNHQRACEDSRREVNAERKPLSGISCLVGPHLEMPHHLKLLSYRKGYREKSTRVRPQETRDDKQHENACTRIHQRPQGIP